MKNHNNLPAFTIMELVIAMLLSAIVIGLMYSAYAIVSQSYLSFTKKNEDISSIAWLAQRMDRDMDKSDLIRRTDSTISMESSRDTVRYRFLKDMVVRQKTQADTFKVSSRDLLTSFGQLPFNDAASTQQPEVIDDLRFSLFFKGQRIPYHYHKTYSSVNLFQTDANAIH